MKLFIDDKEYSEVEVIYDDRVTYRQFGTSAEIGSELTLTVRLLDKPLNTRYGGFGDTRTYELRDVTMILRVSYRGRNDDSSEVMFSVLSRTFVAGETPPLDPPKAS